MKRGGGKREEAIVGGAGHHERSLISTETWTCVDRGVSSTYRQSRRKLLSSKKKKNLEGDIAWIFDLWRVTGEWESLTYNTSAPTNSIQRERCILLRTILYKLHLLCTLGTSGLV